MLRKIVHIIGWVSIAAYLAMALSFTAKMEEDQRVKHLSVDFMDGDDFRFIDSDDVIKVLRLHGFKITGEKIDSISRSSIKEAVKDISEVKDANVYYTPDEELHIQIWQRKPVVRIKNGKYDFYLDEENSPLPFSSRFSPKVLVITGTSDVKLAQNKLFDLAVYIQQDEFFNSFIQEIHVNQKEQLEIIPRVGDHQIFMGETTNYEWKLKKLMAFYQKAIPNLGWNKYNSIDLRFGDQVVCKTIETEFKN